MNEILQLTAWLTTLRVIPMFLCSLYLIVHYGIEFITKLLGSKAKVSLLLNKGGDDYATGRLFDNLR